MFLSLAEKKKNSIGIYIATSILVIFGYFIAQIPLTIVLLFRAKELKMSPKEIEEAVSSSNFAVFGIDLNLILLLILLAFVFATLFLWLGQTKLHQKDFKDLITPRERVNYSKILFSFALWFGLTILVEAFFYFLDPTIYEFQLQLQSFLILAIIAIFILPIQTSFEELFFRGYLLQGFSLISKNRWFPLLITSVLFGLMHAMNPEVSAFGFWKMMSYYIGVGIFLGILTLMDDSLELALGVHAATNIYGALMVTFESSAIQTSAIFKMKEVNVNWMLLAFIFVCIIFYIIVSKKYEFGNWKKVFGPIRLDPTIQHPIQTD